MDTHPARLPSLVTRQGTPPFLLVSAAERGRGPQPLTRVWISWNAGLSAARSDALNFKHRRNL